MSNQSADAVFDALGEPVRRRILELLHEGPTPVGRLAERLPVSRPAVSKHLRVLSLFQDPRFGEHVAFLNRMRQAGFLVAAGPMADADGEGMTILRLPGTGQLSTATRLATEDDTSVSAGFLAVTVRPWQVIMHPAVSTT